LYTSFRQKCGKFKMYGKDSDRSQLYSEKKNEEEIKFGECLTTINSESLFLNLTSKIL
jgi:hypothetical protein